MFKEFRHLDHGAMNGKPVLGHVEPNNLTKMKRKQNSKLLLSCSKHELG